ncbi:NAD-dependent epimerase/dehydratase family protein [Nonomuraea sp. NPDC050643]|uniref:NAD-dependent epimerase/dehydratase family protein n=1 Tax=Nonomuraea sp. NPDC050643 TaxID=3155660 RepID=UPI0033C11041
MPAASDLHVVLGAGGAVGASVVRELAARGHRVRAVNRGGRLPEVPGVEVPGVEIHRGDITTVAGAKAACDGAQVVYHCAAPAYERWTQEFPPMTDAVRQGAATAGAKLVLADNLYMYGPVTGPMTEDLPYAAANPQGRVRAEMAESLLAAHRSGELRVALGRASDYYGPGGVNTGRQFLDLVFAELGRPGRTAALGRPVQRLIGLFNPTVRALGETWYQRDRPFVSDTTKFTRTFGPFAATPHSEAIAATLAWYRANPTP